MIDTNELRRLALDGDLAAMQEIILRLDAAEKSDAESLAMYRKARDERDALHVELNEIRYGAAVAHDTIKALRAKIETAENDAAHQKALAESALRVAEGWEGKCGELRAALQHEADCVEAAKAEIEALRAKIAEMERQEPARLVTPTAYRWRRRGSVMWQYGELTEETARLAKEHNHEVQPLGVIGTYGVGGYVPAQPAPNVPEDSPFIDTSQLEGVVSTDIVHSYPPPSGWLRAIDEALVVAHVGVANAGDTYEQAKAKLDSLISFHVGVATDPAVNGGWQLVPVNPTEAFYQCFSAYDGTSYSNPFDRDEFVKDWREALAKATEAKS